MTRLSAAEPELGDEEKDQLKLQKVIKLQRAFRLLNHVYAHFGGLLFVDAKGDSAHGRITYETSPRGSAWISIAPTTSIPNLYRFMDRFWNMSRPEVIISIPHGLPGSEDVHMPSQLQLAFDRGLVSAAKSAKAWVITSGADCGVAKLVGDVFHRYDVGLPLLGVLPWGFTNGREQLSRSNGSVCTYKPRAYDTEEGAPLNQHHTHFILVDDGQRGGAVWGRDVDEHGRAASSACEQLRIDLEQAVATKKNIPLVQLVVHGGPKTLQAVHRNALGGKPIVVLARMDGGAAAAPSPIRASGPPSPRLGPTASAPILSPSAEQLRRENEQLRAALAVHERAAAAAAPPPPPRGGDDEEVGVLGGGELVGTVDV